MLRLYHIAQHPYIVRLEDFYESRNNFYLCLELHSEMTLRKYISSVQEELEEQFARDIALKIG